MGLRHWPRDAIRLLRASNKAKVYAKATASGGRIDLPTKLREGGVGIELGVAWGYYSDIILSRSRLDRLYSVDAWGDHHDDEEYVRCVRRLAIYGLRSVVMRMRFADALVHFPDGFFDFVYIDAYAATGQENGSLLRDWWPKAKDGAVFGGHDFHPAWPQTFAAVDRFCRDMDRRIVTIDGAQTGHKNDMFDSWYVIK